MPTKKIAFNDIIEKIISTSVNSETRPIIGPPIFQITYGFDDLRSVNARSVYAISNNLNSIVEIGVPDRFIHDNNQVSFWSNLLNSFVRMDETD